MEYWPEIIKTIENIITTTGIVTIPTIAATVIIKTFFNKKVKSFELELNNSFEKYKKELEVQNYKHNKLHDSRTLIIPELYKRIFNLQESMKTLTSRAKFLTGDEAADKKAEIEKANKAENDFIEYTNYYGMKKIFFSKETCTLLDRLKDDFGSGFWKYTYKLRLGLPNSAPNLRLEQEAAKKVEDEIPPLLEQLEKEFRELINVEN